MGTAPRPAADQEPLIRRFLVALAVLVPLLAAPGAGAAQRIAGLHFDPAANGYSFPNYGSGGYQDITPLVMQWLFGSDVCVSGSGETCVLSPPAARWMKTWNGYMAAGHCEGLSITALLFYAGLAKPSAYGGDLVPDLTLFANPDLQSWIAYAYAFQALDSVENAALTGVGPKKVLRKLIKDLGEKAWSIHIYLPDGSGGHAVTPYAVDKLSPSTYAIRIYDNNHPGETRSVLVNKRKDTWSYQASVNPNASESLYQGDATTQTLELWNYEPGLGAQPCPFCHRHRHGHKTVGAVGSVMVALNGEIQTLRDHHAHVLILDKDGKKLGYDGNGKLVRTIRGGKVRRLLNGGIKPWLHAAEPMYFVPGGGRLRILFRGHKFKGHNRQHLSVIGDGIDVGIDDVNAHEGIRDAVSLPGDLEGVTFHSNSPDEQSPQLHLGIDGEKQDYDFAVRGNGLQEGDEVSITLDEEGGTLNITGDQDSVDLDVRRLNPDGTYDAFHHEDVDTGGATAQVHYADWTGTDDPIDITIGGTDQKLNDVKGVTDGDGRPAGTGNSSNDTSAPTLDAGPSALGFGKQAVDGGATATQLAAVTNTGTKNVTLTGVTLGGPGSEHFERVAGETSDCAAGTLLVSGQICQIRVRFDPTGTGAKSARVTVASNAPDVTVDLTGTGTLTELARGVASLAFGPRDIDDGPTAGQTTSLTNTGTEPVTLSAITLGGTGAASFERLTGAAGDCTATTVLNAGDACTLRARFDPALTGPKSASLTVKSNAADVVVGLTGSGIQTELTSTLANFNFGSAELSAGPTGIVSFPYQNTGTETVNLSAVTLGGTDPSQFERLTGLPADCTAATVLAPTQTCNVRVRFDPSVMGAKSASVTVTSNAPDATASLIGFGALTQLSSSVPSIAFAHQDIDDGATGPQGVTVTNTGNQSVIIALVGFTGSDPAHFTQDISIARCHAAQALDPGQSCVAGLEFDPSTTGAKSANYEITSTAPTLDVGLTGTGIQTAITASPTALDFGSLELGSLPAPTLTTTITNVGTEPVTLTGVTFGGTDMAQFSNSGSSCTAATGLLPGQHCDVTAAFQPTTTGTKNATVTVASNAPDVIVNLTGMGIKTLLTSSADLIFGNQDVDDGATLSQGSLIKNAGTEAITLTGVTLGGNNPGNWSEFGTTCTSALVLAPGDTCQVGARFDPVSTGAKSAVFTITSNAPTLIVGLTGRGTQTELTASPSSWDFGTQNTISGATSQKSITVTNTGTETVQFTVISRGGNVADFPLSSGASGDCAANSTLVAGASCVMRFTFDPTSTGSRALAVTINSNAPSLIFHLVGSGYHAELGTSSASVDFGSFETNSGSAAGTVTLTNHGDGYTGLGFDFSGGGEFSVVSTGAVGECTVSTNLAPGASCTLHLAFTPSTDGPQTGTLTIHGDVPDATVSLTGVGVNGAQAACESLGYHYGTTVAGATATIYFTCGAQDGLADFTTEFFAHISEFWTLHVNYCLTRPDGTAAFLNGGWWGLGWYYVCFYNPV